MKQIWDPLRKKYVTATPEEQVRQWFITQLRDLFGVPMGLMMSEAPLTFGLKKFRADIVVYDRQLRPLLIVECKRPEVQIDAEVSRQALRYNSALDVEFIVLTNGNLTYLYERKGESFVPCDKVLSYEEMICRR
ncbi:MAG: type I restriction enzyme HsdR N-terminal domain-containing protein [Bacteroidales bacterium]|nr:type I restriction enzyme HsdR N-terminal domain-containing protein [Bacteroidales bacterium]